MEQYPFYEVIEQYGIYAVFALCTVEGDITLLIAGVVGGEYFLVPGFSLGGEVGLNYLRMGDEDNDGPGGAETDASMIGIGTEFRVRWYFQ